MEAQLSQFSALQHLSLEMLIEAFSHFRRYQWIPLEIGLSVDEFEYYSEDGSGSLPDCDVPGKKL